MLHGQGTGGWGHLMSPGVQGLFHASKKCARRLHKVVSRGRFEGQGGPVCLWAMVCELPSSQGD